MNERKGIFYAVSVGPGDPELLTLRAARILKHCPIIAAPQTVSGRMLALEIAKGAVDLENKTVLPLAFTMSRDAALREESYNRIVETVAEPLSRGLDVAMVNLGDVSVFATACYISERIRLHGFETEMIPGVTSFCAVASVLGCSLTEMELPLHIIPAEANLDEALSLSGTKVLMKSGRAIHKTVDAIKRAGLLNRAALVADCGLPTQEIYRDLSKIPENVSYFATIVVH